MTLQILYFAWVREMTGMGEEKVDVPEDIDTVSDLISHLTTLSNGHAEAFANPARIRVAADQNFVELGAEIKGISEIAFFPPVTGG